MCLSMLSQLCYTRVGGWQQGVALLIFVIVLGIVYVNSNLIHINPMLNLFGYDVYEITFEHSETSSHSLITRRRITRNETLHTIDIGETSTAEKLVYDPSDKWVLLKLLADNYLWSLMTEHSYEVSGKREIE
jgi:hypothetical protein